MSVFYAFLCRKLKWQGFSKFELSWLNILALKCRPVAMQWKRQLQFFKNGIATLLIPTKIFFSGSF